MNVIVTDLGGNSVQQMQRSVPVIESIPGANEHGIHPQITRITRFVRVDIKDTNCWMNYSRVQGSRIILTCMNRFSSLRF